MIKRIEKLQFITNESQEYSHSDLAELAYRFGCKWVQIRIKNSSVHIIEKEAIKAGTILNKVRNKLVFLVIIFAVGFAVGYYFGYDIGFEKAVRILAK